MKALLSLAVLTVIFYGVQGQQMIGNCTLIKYMDGIKSCQTAFIHAMQKNPKSDCSVELPALKDCVSNMIKVCLGSGDSATMVKKLLLDHMTKEFMCDNAGLEVPGKVGGVAVANVTLPCAITMSQYITRMNDCASKLLKMWQADKADPGTCMEYKTTKACYNKVLVDGKCNMTTAELKDIVKDAMNKYNPFCSNGVDPTGMPAVITVPTTPSSASPQAGPFKKLLFFICVAVVTIFSFAV